MEGVWCRIHHHAHNVHMVHTGPCSQAGLHQQVQSAPWLRGCSLGAGRGAHDVHSAHLLQEGQAETPRLAQRGADGHPLQARQLLQHLPPGQAAHTCMIRAACGLLSWIGACAQLEFDSCQVLGCISCLRPDMHAALGSAGHPASSSSTTLCTQTARVRTVAGSMPTCCSQSRSSHPVSSRTRTCTTCAPARPGYCAALSLLALPPRPLQSIWCMGNESWKRMEGVSTQPWLCWRCLHAPCTPKHVGCLILISADQARSCLGLVC